MADRFPDEEEKTKPQSLQIRASDLVRNWAACSPEVQRLIEQFAAEHAEHKEKKKR